MAPFLVGRLTQGAFVVLLASLLVFLVMRLIPGDPAALIAGVEATPADVEAVRERLGLTRIDLGVEVCPLRIYEADLDPPLPCNHPSVPSFMSIHAFHSRLPLVRARWAKPRGNTCPAPGMGKHPNNMYVQTATSS